MQLTVIIPNKGQGNPTSAFPNFLYRLVQHLLVNGVHTLELRKIINIHNFTVISKLYHSFDVINKSSLFTTPSLNSFSRAAPISSSFR